MSFDRFYALRWQILRRDNFTCQYCGQKAPDVVLHVDHRNPKINGGDSSPENLVTACSACNIGKSDYLNDLVRGRPQRQYSYGHMVPHLLAALERLGPSSATTLAREVRYARPNISRVLAGDSHFVKVESRGRDVLYAPA